MEDLTTLTDWVGYAASAGVLSSFLMKGIRKLRMINSIGCGLFVIYGFLLNSWPIIITNMAILVINFYYLFLKKTDRV